MAISKPQNHVTQAMAQAALKYRPDACPDLTRAQVEWFKSTFPLPVWQGDPESAPEYHRQVGHYEIALMLEAQLNARDEGEADMDPLVDGERA